MADPERAAGDTGEPTGSAVSNRFQPAVRIRRRVEYQKIYEQGARQHGRYLTLFFLANGLAFGRLGIAATRKFGGAVARNRAKRQIRDIFRRTKLAPGFDIVVIPKREALDASLTVLEADYRTIVERRLRQHRPVR